MKLTNKTRIEAVKTYFKGNSLKKTAAEYKVHYNTLWRWVRKYKETGIDHLILDSVSARHWRRKPQSLEEKIVALKEKTPCLTIERAHRVLTKQGYKISPKCIWSIWQRFGLTGFRKKNFSVSYREYMYAPAYKTPLILHIKHLIEKGRIKQAAALANSMPVFLDTAILKHIPEKMLSVRRKLDRLTGEFGSIPLSQYRKKAKDLRTDLEKQNMFYSSIRAGIDEGYALMWLGQPEKLNELVTILKTRTRGLRDPGLCFALLLFEGHVHASFLKIPEALTCANRCKTIIRKLTNPESFMGGLASFYSLLGYYKEAIFWTKKALGKAESHLRIHLLASLIGFLTTSGDFQHALKLLKTTSREQWNYHSRVLLIRAFAHLNKGNFQEASSLSTRALLHAKKEEIRRFFHLATFILACCHAAFGEDKEARTILKKYIPFLKKYRLEKEFLLRKILLADTDIPTGALDVPNLKLAFLFLKSSKTQKVNDYRRALQYARSHCLFGLFERLSLFFPKPVVHLLKKGKDPQLPKTFLSMPVFKYELPVYHIRFLGGLRISKGELPLRGLKLSPKENAFLIHLSFSLEQKMLLEPLYRNFWPKSSKPARNLSHLLVRIKKALALPSHALRIRREHLAWDFYLYNDYKYFEELLVQAQTLVRMDEWEFARREYLRAFSLCRGEPFKRMYDNWSEDRRRVILNTLETELKNFENVCQENKDIKIYKRVSAELKNRLPNMTNSVWGFSDT